MKFWFEFEKTGAMKYVSYLDLLQILARGAQRDGVPLAFSKGYNPQPKISFAHPLPLGVDARRDYGEIELAVDDQANRKDDMIARVTKKLPPGFNIWQSKKPRHPKPPKLMSLVKASSYWFDFSEVLSSGQLSELIEESRAQETLQIEKKKQKTGKIVKKDLKPLIYKMVQRNSALEAIFKAGSEGNLRPDDFIKAFLGGETVFKNVSVQRIDVLTEVTEDQQNRFVPLWEWETLQSGRRSIDRNSVS